MGNHAHTLLDRSAAPLSKVFKVINQSYSLFN